MKLNNRQLAAIEKKTNEIQRLTECCKTRDNVTTFSAPTFRLFTDILDRPVLKAVWNHFDGTKTETYSIGKQGKLTLTSKLLKNKYGLYDITNNKRKLL